MALDLNLLLQEAELAYHRMMVGGGVVEIKDQNGESVRYSQTTSRQLLIYINGLKRQLGLAPALGPMRATF